jgi:nicotinate-nucleotide adenylyltransferase
MKIGLFGGSFDPVHNGHLILAEYARRYVDLDIIYFIPCCQSAYRNKQIQASNEHRINMLDLSICKNSSVVSEFETDKGGISYTIDTVRYYKQLYRNEDLYFIAGTDTKDKFNSWKDSEEIKRLVKVIFSNTDFYVPDIGINSTLIRKLVKEGNPITHLVPRLVEDYISVYNLYKEN